MPTPDIHGFARAILNNYWVASHDYHEPDGGDIQELGERYGLLVPHTVTEPCGEYCSCAEWDDFPQTCYRIHEDVLKTKGESDASA